MTDRILKKIEEEMKFQMKFHENKTYKSLILLYNFVQTIFCYNFF